jgi:hypothetical protein
MCGACSTHGEDEKSIQSFFFNKFGLAPLVFSDSEFETYEYIFGHLVRLLGQGISPSQSH